MLRRALVLGFRRVDSSSDVVPRRRSNVHAWGSRRHNPVATQGRIRLFSSKSTADEKIDAIQELSVQAPLQPITPG